MRKARGRRLLARARCLARWPLERALPRLAGVSGVQVVIGLGSLLGLAALYDQWIVFPLTGPVSGAEVLLRLGAGQVLLLALQVGFGLALLLGGQRPGLLAALGSVAVIVVTMTPLQLAFREPDWLTQYTRETEARELIVRLGRQDPVPNINIQPTFVAMDTYDSAADQLRLGTIMLGRGWYLALAAGLVLAALGYRRARSLALVSIVTAAGLIGAVAVLYPPLTGVRQAEQIRATGLVHGMDWQVCDRAYRHNPALAGAVPFLIDCAEALDRASGGRHPLARLPAWWDLRARLGRAELLEPSVWPELEREYQEVLALAPQPDTLEAALANLAHRLHAQILVHLALGLANNGEIARAQALLEQAQPGQPDPAVAYFMLRNAAALRDPARSQQLVDWLDGHVAHRPLLADAHCLLGDALTWRGALATARQAYLECQDLDKTTNYRVIKALSGT